MENGKLKVPKKIDTMVVDKSFFQEAREEGVICYEPCGRWLGDAVALRSEAAIQLEQLPSNLEDARLEDLVQAGALGGEREVNLDEKAIGMVYSASELRMTGGMGDEELAGVLRLAMDRRAMELLFAVAEASTTRLPRSEESQEHGALTVIIIGGLAARARSAT
ncbi:hypothetical protein CYMTET_3299 [Cymbomonas tetramitiformis]|uniref:Uncharacterized protein n=1 Tax=Cymbomonas tetramitiformis TaxID=36881 RepID=A0AAE0LL01_9CHLO|nr:hypothetical protein CYMTET_3299 [Cymbomonas tetramitiformis]